MKKAIGGLVAASILGGIAVVAILIWIFLWYADTVIPHTYPTLYTNGWWGFVHGVMIVPTFFWSLFVNNVTIYQSPNAGNWYNVGYFIGLCMVLGGSSRSAKKRK